MTPTPTAAAMRAELAIKNIEGDWRGAFLAEIIDAEFAEVVALMKDFDKWLDGWCPTHRCCAASAKPLADRLTSALSRLGVRGE